MKLIQLAHAVVTFDPTAAFEDRIRTTFPDGHSWGAYPHQSHHYYVVAHRNGYDDDIWAYAWEHEFAHSFLCERLGGEQSYILRCLATGKVPHPFKVAQEEALVQTFQRWLRGNERPMIEGPWQDLKDEALQLLG